MKKILLLWVVSFQVFAHQLDGKNYSLGVYKDNSFEYPGSLTSEQINFVVEEIARVSKYEILKVAERRDGFYKVTTCSKGERKVGECEEGETYIFGHGRVRFDNFTITPGKHIFLNKRIKDNQVVKFKEYSKGDYDNVPFVYPSTLSIAQVEEIIEHLAKVTPFEIKSIAPDIEGDQIGYIVSTCTTGARIKYFCDGGKSYRYDFETQKLTERSGWIQ